jgi:hypothetical protein
MALKQDDRALLQLLSERGQSYSDLAGLLGLSEAAVREKARAALAQVGGGDPDAEVGLTDYLLGQADPIGRADAVRYLQDHPEALELAERIAVGLRAIAPGAQLPRLPQPRGRRAAAPPTGEPGPAARGDGAPEPVRRSPSPRQARLIAAIGAAGLILLIAILALTGAIGGGAEGDGSTPEEIAAEEQRDVTPVRLRPQGGSGVAGQANFGLANELLTVDLRLDGLRPRPPRGSVYVLWLMLSEQAGYPVTILQPDDNGSIEDSYSVPTAIAVAVGSRARFVQVSQGPAEDLQEQIDDAVQENVPLVPFSGELLARGRIPLAEQPDEG